MVELHTEPAVATQTLQTVSEKWIFFPASDPLLYSPCAPSAKLIFLPLCITHSHVHTVLDWDTPIHYRA